ncbi:hypothetical protein SCUP515_02543 [Seiridium cupressi]
MAPLRDPTAWNGHASEVEALCQSEGSECMPQQQVRGSMAIFAHCHAHRDCNGQGSAKNAAQFGSTTEWTPHLSARNMTSDSSPIWSVPGQRTMVPRRRKWREPGLHPGCPSISRPSASPDADTRRLKDFNNGNNPDRPFRT